MPFGENLQTCGPSGPQVFLLTFISEVKNLLRCPKGINKKKKGEKVFALWGTCHCFLEAACVESR